MNYPVHLTDEAIQEETEAFLFYEEQLEGLGERFLLEVERTLAKVAENPTYYSFIDETKTIRDVALRRFPFVVIFEAKAERVVVYHIHHTKKNL